MRGQRGFVLVNALVLVAALAMVAAFMLGRAESARQRGAAGLEAAQLRLYLDAYETLAREILERDAAGGAPSDHPGEAWAQDVPPVPLDRGRVTGKIRDLQGRFNLNRLANPADEQGRAAFDRLALRLGLAPQRVEEIVDFLSPGGPENLRDYARNDPPTLPVGGALLMREQLRQVPNLTRRDYDRLLPYVAVLPAGAGINVNTVSPEVLASLFPSANAAAIDALIQSARRQPFGSIDAFYQEMLRLRVVAEQDIADLPDGVLGVASSWFEVEIAAELDGRVATRRAVINRLPLPQPSQVTYRLDNWNGTGPAGG